MTPSLLTDEQRQAALDQIEAAWRECFLPPPQLLPSDWCERNLIIHESARPGPLRLSVTPYLREIIDNMHCDSGVERISVMCSTQIGKTLAETAALSYGISHDPGDTLFVMPREQDAKDFSRGRLRSVIQNCPAIRDRLQQDTGKDNILTKYFDRCTLRLSGNSPSALASSAIRYLFMDEVDKFTEATETEAPAINLAIERTNTYFNRKIFMASTPTVSGSAIHRAFLSGDQRYYQVSCPRCKEFQKLVFDGLKWGEDLKINGGWDYDAVKATAYYQCQRCEKPIHSYQKHQLLSTGIWVPEGKAGSHRSYHLSALYSPFLSFGDFAVEFLRSKKDLGSYRNFYNSWRGEIWQEISQSASTSQILDHKLQYPEGICPENPLAVIMTADLGKHQIWYVIRAWCHNETSYLLRYGSVPNMAALNDVARSVFKSPSGDVVVTHKLIDSGYETDEVYKFCRETGFIPVKGLQSASQPTSWSKVDSYDGMNRCLVDTTAYKDSIQRKLLITPGDPGSWNLHETTNELYSSHLTAEIAVEQTNAYGVPKRIWKRIRAANHLLDCEVYNFAAASVLNIKFQAAPVPVVIHRSEQKQKKSPSTQRTFNRPDGRTFWEIR